MTQVSLLKRRAKFEARKEYLKRKSPSDRPFTVLKPILDRKLMAAHIIGNWRYWLKRRVGVGNRLIVWVMLNPSTADHMKDDNTIRRVMRFSREWGFDVLIVVNVFAYRARNPDVMKKHLVTAGSEQTIGPDNPFWVNYWMDRADQVMIGWGNNFTFEPKEIIKTFPQAMCLGLTKSFQPKHPLMIAANTEPVSYEQDYTHALAQVPYMHKRKPRRPRKHAYKIR